MVWKKIVLGILAAIVIVAFFYFWTTGSEFQSQLRYRIDGLSSSETSTTANVPSFDIIAVSLSNNQPIEGCPPAGKQCIENSPLSESAKALCIDYYDAAEQFDARILGMLPVEAGIRIYLSSVLPDDPSTSFDPLTGEPFPAMAPGTDDMDFIGRQNLAWMLSDCLENIYQWDHLTRLNKTQ